ncbi:MAG: alpha/beta hydrolase [Solobacterium sp.]|nr:alpha/beta hydrolase [Solobacterium sp.]
MSMTYEILKRAVRASGLKKRMDQSAEEIIAMKKKQNAKNRIPDLRDNEVIVQKTEVMGFTVLRILHHPRSEKANLFIIGGGMVTPPRPGSIRKAVKIAKETGLDLYVPYYPLCTDYPVTKAYEMILETYRTMLEDYQPECISVLGTSSGGNLALGMIAYMNETGSDLKRPGHIIAISPGACPDSEEEYRRMKELDAKDVIISEKYMVTAEEILRHGDDTVPDYMIHLQNGNFSGCPHVTMIYGSDEVLYAIAPSFEAELKKYNVSCDLIVGEGMFHCYPVFPFCREAQEGWDLMIRLMKQ